MKPENRLINRILNRKESSHWETMSTPEQRKQRDEIEMMAKEKNIPPSEMEYELIMEGKIKEDWAAVD